MKRRHRVRSPPARSFLLAFFDLFLFLFLAVVIYRVAGVSWVGACAFFPNFPSLGGGGGGGAVGSYISAVFWAFRSFVFSRFRLFSSLLLFFFCPCGRDGNGREWTGREKGESERCRFGLDLSFFLSVVWHSLSICFLFFFHCSALSAILETVTVSRSLVFPVYIFERIG